MSDLIIAANTATPVSAPAGKTAAAAPSQKASDAKPVAKASAEVKAAPEKSAPVAKNTTVAGAPAADGKNTVKTHTVQPDPTKDAKQRQQQPNQWLSFLPIILIFVVMIFFMNRSQKKQMQKRQEMMDKIAKGTKVLLASGIYGTVDAVHEDSMIVEIAAGVKVKVSKSGIAGIDTPEAEGKAEGK